MSMTYNESPLYWERYLSECRETGTTPQLKDYDVWLADQDIDEDTDWESNMDDEEVK